MAQLRLAPARGAPQHYAGSGSRPPWVRIYCPQVVDDLISRGDVLGVGLCFCFLSTEAAVGGPAWFFAERAADCTSWLVKFCAVGSPWGAGKAYLCVAGTHWGVVREVDSIGYELG